MFCCTIQESSKGWFYSTYSLMPFLMLADDILFHYRNTSLMDTTNHFTCTFSREVLVAKVIIINSPFVTSFPFLSCHASNTCYNTNIHTYLHLCRKYHWMKARYHKYSLCNVLDLPERMWYFHFFGASFQCVIRTSCLRLQNLIYFCISNFSHFVGHESEFLSWWRHP
jgi:hypothetical protein